MESVIELSSDDENETPIQKENQVVVIVTVQQQQQEQHCQTSTTEMRKIKNPRKSDDKAILKDEYDFVDHVVLIWLKRVRRGYKNLDMPDEILKTKATEALCMLGLEEMISLTDWLCRFQRKLKQINDEGRPINSDRSCSYKIAEIIKEERAKFFGNNDDDDDNSKKLPVVDFIEESEESRQQKINKIMEDRRRDLEKNKEAQMKTMQMIKQAQQKRDANLRLQEENKLARQRLQEETRLARKEMLTDKEKAKNLAMEQLKELKPGPDRQRRKKQNLSDLEEQKKVQNEGKNVVATSLILIENLDQQMHKNAGLSSVPTQRTVAPIPAIAPAPIPAPTQCDEVINLDDPLDDPIQSYEEAWDCLTLVENYLLSVRNLNAVSLINQIEICLKNQLQS